LRLHHAAQVAVRELLDWVVNREAGIVDEDVDLDALPRQADDHVAAARVVQVQGKPLAAPALDLGYQLRSLARVP
jgi:hypothetical protein